MLETGKPGPEDVGAYEESPSQEVADDKAKSGLWWVIDSAKDGQIRELVKEILISGSARWLQKKVNLYLDEQGRELPPEISAEYEEQSQVLQQVIGNNAANNFVFHGTGLYKYGGSKYGGVDATTVNVLSKILSEGLVPQPDPWIPGQEMKSSSFATRYMYAKTYAMRFNSQDAQTRWNYGDYRDWFMFYLSNMMRGLAGQALKKRINNLIHPQANQIAMQRGFGQSTDLMRQWTAGYLSETSAQGMSHLEILKSSVTDIPNNYGIVLAAKREDIGEIDTRYHLGHEVRGGIAVPFEKIACLMVPSSKRVETEALVESSGLNVPVISMEAADYFVSKLPPPSFANETK